MFRALLELVVTIIVAMAARAIFGSLMKGFANASRNGFNQQQQQPEQAAPPRKQPQGEVKTAGELHKDPVCGMYVAESTRFQRRNGRDTIYYCSEECKDKHAVAAR